MRIFRFRDPRQFCGRQTPDKEFWKGLPGLTRCHGPGQCSLDKLIRVTVAEFVPQRRGLHLEQRAAGADAVETKESHFQNNSTDFFL
jgi:hypothetical protein